MDRNVNNEPTCRRGCVHDYFVLGIEDNGEKVSRCGTCMTLRYELKGKVRYETGIKRKSKLRRPSAEIRRKRAELRARRR